MSFDKGDCAFVFFVVFFFQAEDGIRDSPVTGVQTCALPIFFLAVFTVFAFIFVMIFSNFGSYPAGVGSGSWQSLGYWIAQQDVARGNQPWYYYFMLGSVYEFLPFVLAGSAIVYYGLKSGFRSEEHTSESSHW